VRERHHPLQRHHQRAGAGRRSARQRHNKTSMSRSLAVNSTGNDDNFWTVTN
jgi:hypothetical protein